MSESQYGRNMDRPLRAEGSVKRARERAQAGQPLPPRWPQETMTDGSSSPKGHLSPPPRRHMPPSQPPPPLPGFITPPSARSRDSPGPDGKKGPIISRPTQVPHWPLPPGSPLTVGPNGGYTPPAGRSNVAPPRPARPSRIPSMVDQTLPQQPTPVFFNPPPRADENTVPAAYHQPPSPTGGSSARFTSSSVGTIPEFPAPGAGPTPPVPTPPRRSMNLGPPPSSRRGASSFYSNASYVSPIPEESSRSRGSYASSAAMPGATWTPSSPTASPQHGDSFYDDSMTEKSRDSMADEFEDESKLVRSASIGKKTKAALVNNKPGAAATGISRPSPQPVQAFENGTAYMDETGSSSNTVPIQQVAAGDTAAREENQFLAPGAMEPNSNSPRLSPQIASSSRLSALKRPPKLDIDAVRAAEARGSMTSLPDLIKRATRLASMIERGKRPASRLDNFNDLLFDKSNVRDGDRDDSSNDRYQSGLSDMLAAFPPPAQLTPMEANQTRGSWFRTTSWPLAPTRHAGADAGYPTEKNPSQQEKNKPARKCCGMPPWAFVLVILLIIGVIATAVLIPLSFFVFKTLGNHETVLSPAEQCRADLTCQNGGTNVLTKGACSCICTNGFTGSDCSVRGSEGCTTTNIVSQDSSNNINNVTLGTAIPRLIADAKANFSIPLSGTQILAKINSNEFSCRAQNSLVTLDGRSKPLGQTASEINEVEDDLDATAKTSTQARSLIEELDTRASSDKKSNFTASEEILDFARVVILYILQEEDTDSAETAQATLQSVFSKADESNPRYEGITIHEARNVTLGTENTVNLVDFRVDIGNGTIGRSKSSSKRSIFADLLQGSVHRRGGSVVPRP